MATYAIVVAAGQGTRFGGDLPKQFLLLRDRPILAHALQRFEQSELIEKIVVVAAPAWSAYISREIIARFRFNKCQPLVHGGERRQDSVWAGVQALPLKAKDIVVVHDAVRPLFSPALLGKVVAACERYDGCIPALSPADTVKEVSGAAIIATLDRERLKLAQTPQAFRHEVLQRAFQRAQREGWHGTDEATLVERSGGRMCWVEGEIFNLKITTPHDLQLAGLFAQQSGI